MRKLALIVATALLLGSFPVATANHITVGTYDNVGTSADENPNDEDRTVPGTTLGENAPDSEKEYAIGTTGQENCHDPSGDLSAEEVNQTANAHGFCGMLIYHEGDEDLEQVSLPDQDLKDPIGTFDVTRAQSYSQSLGTCHPFCQQIEGQENPTADPLFNATHTAGSAAGVTDGPDTAYEEEQDRGPSAGATVHLTSPTNVVQDSTGLWEMNGWWWPAATSTFVAFIHDDQGNVIDDERLDQIVEDKRENGVLDSTTEAAVCGYTPDFQFTTVGPGASGLNCEFGFTFVGEDEDSGDGTTLDGYENECNTPTYVCGGTNGGPPAWYSQPCTCLGLADPKIPGSDPLPIPDSPLAGPEGQTDYVRWHFVIAPHNSECAGAQEPGFAFDSGDGSEPYLAHDLDVWTTAASTSYSDAGSAVPEALDYSDEAAETFTGEVAGVIDTVNDQVPETADLPSETNNFVRETMLEPNLATGHTVGDLDDTSRTFEDGELNGDELQRDLTDAGACELLFASEEPGVTEDPWVDYIDSRAMGAQDVDAMGTYATDERVIRQIGPYMSAAEEHDGTNRPGPSLYQTDGKVGMFTDKDDDGEYDQLEAGVKYNSQNPFNSGAYPMIWDMNLVENEDDELVPDENHTLSEAASDLGYGKHTGLVQAIYLNEPTAFVETDNQQPVPYTSGNNIYLLMSQGAHELTSEEAPANPVDNRVEDLVDELKTYVTDDLGRDEPDVIRVGDDLGLDATFTDQSSGPTGNFNSVVQFAHDCQAFDCSGDTIATMYTFELTDGTLQGSEVLPDFEFSEDGPFDFGQGQHAWYDIDPFDNNPDRNEQRKDTPPNPDAGYLGEGTSDGALE